MEANYVHKDSTTLVQDETGTYVEIPRNRITFKSKEAEIIFDLTLENDELRLKNQELREKLDKYENSEDMTLMMMWCTEQVKDENKKLKKKYENAVADYETTMAEKEELKKHLEVPETCNLKTLEDYKSYYEDTTREQILTDTYIKYCAYVNLAHEYSKLEKQLENYKNSQSCSFINVCKNVKIANYNQQKEFIKYLEYEIKKLKERDIYQPLQRMALAILEHNLQKYKSIIGVSDEKK